LPSAQACADGSRRHLAVGTITPRHSQSCRWHRLAVGTASCADGKAVGIEITPFGNSGSNFFKKINLKFFQNFFFIFFYPNFFNLSHAPF
jgi:hypothetical protein